MDVWLIGILPVTLYPSLGGKVWCRYWCPLAMLMDLMSKFYAMKQETLDNSNASRIGCGIYVTVCPMDVLSFSAESEFELARIEAA